MKCLRCGNEITSYFYKGERGLYCRKCVRFCDAGIVEDESKQLDSSYLLPFELTDKQKEISKQLSEFVLNGNSVLLEAVCGAGKTELVIEMISTQLALGNKVGFAIARRQVVLEIAERLKKAFTNLKVIPVCQGFTSDINGDLIICTTHQLYRYKNYFDVLIIDEPDAFPYKGNIVLKGISKNAYKTSVVYLTATPDSELVQLVKEEKLKHLYLSRRAHNNDLPVPEVIYGSYIKMIIEGIYWLNKQLKNNKQIVVFVPTIKLARLIYLFLKRSYNICQIDSKSDRRDEIINDFKQGKYDSCIATTVLERGVTIPRINVLVWNADNQVFDTASLIQMSGRVGRSMDCPSGECLFICNKKEKSVDECIDLIRKANEYG